MPQNMDIDATKILIFMFFQTKWAVSVIFKGDPLLFTEFEICCLEFACCGRSFWSTKSL